MASCVQSTVWAVRESGRMGEAAVHGALRHHSDEASPAPLSWIVWQGNTSEEVSCPPKLCESPPGSLDQAQDSKQNQDEV